MPPPESPLREGLGGMHTFFTLVPPVAYWMIVLLWTIILVVLVRKLRSAPTRDRTISLLVFVLALDAFRTLLESVFFGAYWNAIYGIFPDSWRVALQDPILVAIPKLVTVAVGILIVVLLLRRWFPAAEQARALAAPSLQQSRLQTVRAEMKYQRIVEMSLDVICTLDAASCFVDVSPRSHDIWGYAPEEMIGRCFTDFLHPDDRACSLEEAEAIRRGVTSGSYENRHLHKDGHIVYMMWSSVWSEQDQLFYAVARDVTRRHALETRRRELEERLHQSQRLESVGQLTGGVAHDFNNLLTVILGNAKLLEDKLRGDAELRRVVETTHIAAQRGAELTQRLLTFSRRQSLEPRRLDPNRLMRGVEALMRRLLGERIEIRLDLDPAPWPIHVDPLQLESAVINLGVNARDAMPGGGELTIRTTHWHLNHSIADPAAGEEIGAGEYVAISVRDGGTGMTPEVLARVFEPFYTTKEKGKGSGLGLSMVYGFVRQSGGHVLIDTAPGRGTTVTLLFPRDAGELSEERPNEAAGATLAQGGGEIVLLAEDNELVRVYTAELLRKLGYRVIEAEDGPDALAALKRHSDIALLLSDMMMPGGMTGVELARAARQARPGLRVLLTSGYVDEDGRQDATAEDLRVLRKPYHGAQLAQALREVLGK
jgi:PAS domain S-box-containing protein